MSFDKIFDLTAGVYFNFYNNAPGTRIPVVPVLGSILLFSGSVMVLS